MYTWFCYEIHDCRLGHNGRNIETIDLSLAEILQVYLVDDCICQLQLLATSGSGGRIFLFIWWNSRNMWKICRGELRNLANCPTEFGKIWHRKLWSLDSAGLMPTEARGNFLPEAPYLRETKTVRLIKTYLIVDANCTHNLDRSYRLWESEVAGASIPKSHDANLPLPFLPPPSPSPLSSLLFCSLRLELGPPQIQLGGLGERCELPQRGLGERCELPQRGLGQSTSRNWIWCILALKYDIWWQQC